jgi:hypothetical protein
MGAIDSGIGTVLVVLREVILENRASSVIDKSVAEHPHFDEVYRALEWRIARNPEVGVLVAGFEPPRRVIRSTSWPAFPGALVLTYTYTAEVVTVIGAKVIPPGSTGAAKVKSA